jgi:hypothetical protein
MKCVWQGKPKYSEKTCSYAILSITNPTCQTRARTPAAAVGSQRLTASAMTRPDSYLSLYGSIFLLNLGRFFSSIIYTQSVGFPGRGISAERFLPTRRTTQTHNKCTQISMLFLIRIVRGGVHTVSTRHVGHFWPIVPAPGDCENGEFGGIKIGRVNRSPRRKLAPPPLYPSQIPLD